MFEKSYASPGDLLSKLTEKSEREIKEIYDRIKKMDCDSFNSLFNVDISAALNEIHIHYLFNGLKLTLYRGERDSSWNYTSSAKRSKLNFGLLDLIRESFFKNIARTEWYVANMSISINGETSTLKDDEVAISQHFGIPTDYVDFTLDPRVALFFACTKKEGNKYVPCTEGKGRIYMYEVDFFDLLFGRCEVNVIQYSVFSRAYDQKAFLIKHSDKSEGGCLKSCFFTHDGDFSKQIYEMYNCGEKLMGQGFNNSIEEIGSKLVAFMSNPAQAYHSFDSEKLDDIKTRFYSSDFYVNLSNSLLNINPSIRVYDKSVSDMCDEFKKDDASLEKVYDLLSLSKLGRIQNNVVISKL